MIPTMDAVFMRYPCCIVNHPRGFSLFSPALCLIHSSMFFNLSASVRKSVSPASAILWSHTDFQCSLLSSTAGALNGAHEKSKALAVPTWSFCKIPGSARKQGLAKTQRTSDGLTVSNPPPSHAPCPHFSRPRSFLARAYFPILCACSSSRLNAAISVHCSLPSSALDESKAWRRYILIGPEDNVAKTDAIQLDVRVKNALETPTDLDRKGVTEITSSLRELLADVFALYVKTKNFHWHMSGRHFRDYHLLLDEHAEQVFAMTDDIAERARKIGGTTLRSIGDIAENQRLKDNNAEFVGPKEMLGELAADNLQLTRFLRSTHEICDRHNDVATASLIENWIDESERRTWFLSEIVSGR